MKFGTIMAAVATLGVSAKEDPYKVEAAEDNETFLRYVTYRRYSYGYYGYAAPHYTTSYVTPGCKRVLYVRRDVYGAIVG